MDESAAFLGDRIRQRLADLDRDAAWLASVLEVNPSTVSRWLDGSTYPADARLREIARALHRPVRYFTVPESLLRRAEQPREAAVA